MEFDPGLLSDLPIDPKRRDELKKVAKFSSSMTLARFYLASSEYVKDDLPDTRSNDEYFKTLEDPRDSKEKRKKMRQAAEMLVRFLDGTGTALCENAEEKIFLSHVESLFTSKLIRAIDAKRIARWPRFVVNDSEYNGNSDSLTISKLALEEYVESGKTCEIDYDVKLELDEVEFKRRTQKTFGYKSGQVNLDFVENLTPPIERLILNKLKSIFGSQKIAGFSVHHVIPHKKLEIFFNLIEKFWEKGHLRPDKEKRLFKKRIQQCLRLRQLCYQFSQNGLMTALQPYSSQMCDELLSRAGNIFYGPRLRSDDDCNGLEVDRAAAVVLSEDEYASIVRLDGELNGFFESYGLEVDQLVRLSTADPIVQKAIDQIVTGYFQQKILFRYIDHLSLCTRLYRLMELIMSTFRKISKNHGLKSYLEPIRFDPRLVDRKEGESRWSYRSRQIAERSLPDWLSTLLKDVSREMKVKLLIDLNLTPQKGRLKNFTWRKLQTILASFFFLLTVFWNVRNANHNNFLNNV